MVQGFCGRRRFATRLLGIAFALALGAALSSAVIDGNRMSWDGKGRLFVTVKTGGEIDKGGILFGRPDPKGPLYMAERRADGSISPDRATINLDGAGRVTSILSKEMRNYIVYGAGGASLSSSTKKGSYSMEVVSGNPAFPALLLPFLAGSLPLFSVDQAQGLSLVLFKEDGIDAYEGWLKVLRKERVTTRAGSFEALVLELGVSGFVGLFAPKVPIWIDAATRQTVKIGFPDSSFELAEVR